MRFSDIVLAGLSASAASAAPSKRAGKFIFTGANEAGGEFGEANLPGQYNKDYIWPDTAAIDVSN